MSGALLLALSSGPAAALQQPPVPRPFPTPDARPGEPGAQVGQPPDGAPALPAVEADVPTEATLGVPIYPTAQYLTSYDAGRGQRFHLFGTTASFGEMVRYYSEMLDERGRRVYNAPAIHQFETARFRDEFMDYRPSVTIKDYTWNGSDGYPNTTSGGDPAAFPTIIQITTPPAGMQAR